jgi:plasmid stabilization system protein ParE
VKVKWSELAELRAAEAMDYIARERPQSAVAWLDELLARVARLDRFPNRGRVVPEIGRPEYRELIISPYRVVYRVDPARVVILTVRHGRQDWDNAEVLDGS